MDLHESTNCKAKDTASVVMHLALIRGALLQQSYATPEKAPEHHRRDHNLGHQYPLLLIQPRCVGSTLLDGRIRPSLQ